MMIPESALPPVADSEATAAAAAAAASKDKNDDDVEVEEVQAEYTDSSSQKNNNNNNNNTVAKVLEESKEEDDEDELQKYNYVDYTVIPIPAKILPPAKYKLYLIVTFFVYFAVWIEHAANVMDVLRFNGYLSVNGAIFLNFALNMVVLQYSTIEMFIDLFTFRSKNGKIFGVGAWLKQPRLATWIRNRPSYDNNFFIGLLVGIISILEEGFGMFDAPSSSSSDNDDFQLETTKPKRYFSISSSSSTNSRPFTIDDDNANNDNNGNNNNNNNGDKNNDNNMLWLLQQQKKEMVLKIEHRIDITKIQKYNQWLSKMTRVCEDHSQRGLLNIHTFTNNNSKEGKDLELGETCRVGVISPTTTTTTATATTATNSSNNNNNNNNNIDDNDDDLLHSVYLTFQDLECLNEWMISPRRQILMEDLRPLLAKPNVIQLQLDRQLPGVFTDLVARQGMSVPIQPPYKWKVGWLTTIGLFLSFKWVNYFMEYYYEFWNLNQPHLVRLKQLIDNIIFVFIAFYIVVPLLLMIFDPWVKKRDYDTKNKNNNGEEDETATSTKREPWRTINDGFQSIWWKILLTLGFYGACIIVGIVKQGWGWKAN